MTDAELESLTQRAIDGTLTEAEYDALTAQAVESFERLTKSEAAMQAACQNVFVDAPRKPPIRRRIR
jgi:hypothetical protein